MKIEIITINTLLSVRNKFVYSCSIKIHTLGFSRLLESIFCLLMVVEMFSLQKVVEMLEKLVLGWWEIRRMWQMRQTKSHSPICSAFEALVVWCVVRCCCGEELGPYCWPVLAAVFNASHWFAEHISQIQWFHQDSESCGGSDGQQTTKPWWWPFWVQVWLWEVLWSFLLVQSLRWSSLVVLYNLLFVTCPDPKMFRCCCVE